ncbi:MAG: PocR ligand-binding domain-containing protein [Clostridia bacterium]
MAATIYGLIAKDTLSELLTVLSGCLELPVQLLDEHGEMLNHKGGETSYCALLKKKVFTGTECIDMHTQAAKRAQELGESYIFSCHANLNHIAFPLASHGILLGSIIIGPFLMDIPDSTLIVDLAESHGLSPSICLPLYDELQTVRVLAPARVNLISKLVDHLLTPLLPAERLLQLEKQEKLYQQSKINETVQMYKGAAVASHDRYPYEKERELLVKVKTGDLPAAKAILNDLLGYVLFTEGGQIEVIKSRALELTTLLSRVAIEGGAQADDIYHLNHQFLSRLRNLNEYEALCYQLQEIVESFVSAVSMPSTQSGSAAIRVAIRFIAKHYAEPLTLSQLASEVSLSPSYFSAQFAKIMGMGYREYVNFVRVEEAKRLLSATDYPLSQIAVAIGFSDQSYFSKVFKRATGLSPQKYR